MRRLILIIAILTAPIMQNAWADSISVSCMNVNDYNFKWTDPGNACGVGDMALYGEAVASEYDYLLYTMNATSPSIPSAATIESLVVYVKGADAGATDTKIQFTDDVNGEVGYPYTVTWAASNIYRAYAGHGLWGTGWTSPTLFNDGFGYMIRLVPETDADYSSNNLTVDDLYMTIFYTLPPPDTALYAYIDSLHNDYPLVTGPNGPVSGDSVFGGSNWGLKSNVWKSDNAYARTGLNKTDSLIVRYFGLGIPTLNVVHGVKVEIECKGVFTVGNVANMQVALTADGTTKIEDVEWQNVVVDGTEGYETIGCDTCGWGGIQGIIGYRGIDVNKSVFGVLVKVESSSTLDSLFVDFVRMTVWHGSENDSIIVYAETGPQTWPDSVIFCVDTLYGVWPDTDTYSWRSAVPYAASSGIYDTLLIYNIEEDTVKVSAYIKDNASGYSAPVHYWKQFIVGGVNGVSNMTSLNVNAVSSPDQWINVGGASKVISVTDAVDANYIYTATQGYKQRFLVTNNTTIASDDLIDSVRVVARVQRSGTGTNTMRWNQIMPGDPPTVVNGTTYSLTSLWVTIYHLSKTTSAPGRTGNWTAAQLDSLEIEVENVAEASARQHRCTRLYVEIYYRPCIDSNSFRVDDPDGSYPYKDDGTFGHGVGLFLLDGGEVTCGKVDNYIWDASWRFHNNKIPNGKIFGAEKYIEVDSAWLSVTAALTSADNINTRLYGEYADSAISFSADTTVWKARTRTTAYCDWDITADWTLGTVYRSPDISNIIEEIVGRTGWKAGHSIVIFWQDDGTSGTTARQQIRSEDFADGPGAPVLNIWWHCYGGAAPARKYRRSKVITLNAPLMGE